MTATAGELAYISNEDSGTISVLDLESLTIVDTIAVGRRPRGIRATRDGKYIFVALSGSPKCPPSMSDADCHAQTTDKSQDGIAMVDARSRQKVRVFPGGSDPEQFDLSRDEKYLFISNEDAGVASVVDIASAKLIAEVPVGDEPEGVRVSPDGSVVLVTSEEEHSVSVLDGQSFALLHTFDVGLRPRDLIFSHDYSLLFVSSEFSRRVDIFDARDYSALGQVELGETALPMGLAISSDDKTLYVANGRAGTVSVIDIKSRQVSAVLEVGRRPWGLALSTDDRILISANGPSDDVSVIDTATMTLRKKISVGETPWGLVIAPAP
ncbi:MAG: beta-propeller fold lactonase family protein [Proteobacteria bacterium]|nr:beta-propeller fold lactonase family protein [Pseudomonadota bacterium]